MWKSYKELSSEEKQIAVTRALAWNRSHPEERKLIRYRERLRRLYNISAYEHEIMMLCQGNTCVVCGEEGTENRVLDVDHCHQTGQIRALLCPKCNMALGSANDDPQRLRELAAYLEEF